DCIILSHLPPGHTDTPDDLPIDGPKGDSTGKRYEVFIGKLNSMRICPCFAEVIHDLRFHFEQGGCFRFLNSHIDHSKPCSVHAMKCFQVASRIKDCDAN